MRTSSLQGSKCKDAAHSDFLRHFHMKLPHEWDWDDQYDDVDEDVRDCDRLVDLICICTAQAGCFGPVANMGGYGSANKQESKEVADTPNGSQADGGPCDV